MLLPHITVEIDPPSSRCISCVDISNRFVCLYFLQLVSTFPTTCWTNSSHDPISFDFQTRVERRSTSDTRTENDMSEWRPQVSNLPSSRNSSIFPLKWRLSSSALSWCLLHLVRYCDALLPLAFERDTARTLLSSSLSVWPHPSHVNYETRGPKQSPLWSEVILFVL